MSEHPMQPIEVDSQGVVRFKRNAIVKYLLDHSTSDLTEIWVKVSRGELSAEDYRQLMQLIGYSISGYGDLAYSGDDRDWQTEADSVDAIADGTYRNWEIVKEEGKA